MLFKKKDFPKTGDIVVCTVKRIQHPSVFVKLEEYEDRTGMVHISEVAYGRIRNIRDYVKEEKMVICRVVHVEKEKNNIDLSIKRVKGFEARDKLNEFKRDSRFEALMSAASKKLKKNLEWMYANFGNKVVEEYGSLSNFLDYFLEKPELIDELDVNKDAKKAMKEILHSVAELKEKQIVHSITLQSFEPDGISRIRQFCAELEKSLNADDATASVSYVSAPRYSVTVTTKDPKKAEKLIKSAFEELDKKAKSQKINFAVEKK